jgi:hypothetical protein
MDRPRRFAAGRNARRIDRSGHARRTDGDSAPRGGARCQQFVRYASAPSCGPELWQSGSGPRNAIAKDRAGPSPEPKLGDCVRRGRRRRRSGDGRRGTPSVGRPHLLSVLVQFLSHKATTPATNAALGTDTDATSTAAVKESEGGRSRPGTGPQIASLPLDCRSRHLSRPARLSRSVAISSQLSGRNGISSRHSRLAGGARVPGRLHPLSPDRRGSNFPDSVPGPEGVAQTRVRGRSL